MVRPNTAIKTEEVWLSSGILTGGCDTFPRAKGRLKQTETRLSYSEW